MTAAINSCIFILIFFDFICRLFLVIPSCDQQGSLDLNSSTVLPLLLSLSHTSSNCLLLVAFVSSPFNGGECATLTWRMVAMETVGAVAVATGLFMIWSNEMAGNTSLQLSRSVVDVLGGG